MTEVSQNNKRIAKNTMFLYLRMMFLMVVSFFTSRVLLDKLGIEDVETLKMYCEEVDSLAESVLKEDVSMQDIIDTLRDEKGFTITNETLVSIDPGLAQYLKPSDEK